MTLAGIIKQVLDGLWLVGGIVAVADLSMEDFGPGAESPCPFKDQSPHCSNHEACVCRAPLSIPSAPPPPR